MKTRRRSTIVAFVTLGIVSAVVGLEQSQRHHAATHVLGAKLLSANSSFAINSDAPASPLVPGQAASVTLRVSNLLGAQITVTQVVANLTSALTGNCEASDFQMGGIAFAKAATDDYPNVTINLSPGITATASDGTTNGTGTGTTSLKLVDTTSNQDDCKNQTLRFSYAATAYYTDLTTTVLAASPSYQAFGQPVTLSAMVSPTYSGMVPTGSVSFYSGATLLSGSPQPLVAGQATLTTTSLPSGLNTAIHAVYNPSGMHAAAGAAGPDFLTSTSPNVTVSVSSACITSKRSLKTVAARQFVCIGSGGMAQGGTTVQGGGALIVLNGGAVSGGLTIQSSGKLFVDGGAVSGGLVSTGASIFQICGGNLSGGVTVQNSLGFVQIGDGDGDANPTCAGNNISGGLKVLNNSNGVEVGGNPNISGGITWTNNAGSGPGAEDKTPELDGNSISGGLTCTGTSGNLVNDGHANTVSGGRHGDTPCTLTSF